MTLRSHFIGLLTPHTVVLSSLSEAYSGVWVQSTGEVLTAESMGRYGRTRTVQEAAAPPFEARVDGQAFLRALKASREEVLEVGVDEKNRLEVQLESHVVRLPTYPEPDWGVPVSVTGARFILDRHDFTEVSVASDESDKKPNCNGVQIEDGWMFATDSYRLHAVRINVSGPLRLPGTLVDLVKQDGAFGIEFTVDDKRVQVIGNGWEHTTPLLTKAPIKWQALRREPRHFLEFPDELATQLIVALRRTAKLTDGPGVLGAQDGALILSTVDGVTETVLAEDVEFPIRVAFNIQYLLDAILFSGYKDILTLEFYDALSPICIKHENRMALVMPIRV